MKLNSFIPSKNNLPSKRRKKGEMSTQVDLTSVVNIVIAIVPLIVVIAVLKMLMRMFEGFGQ